MILYLRCLSVSEVCFRSYCFRSFGSVASVLLAGPKEPKGQGRVKIYGREHGGSTRRTGNSPSGLRHPGAMPRSRHRSLPIFTMRPPSGWHLLYTMTSSLHDGVFLWGMVYSLYLLSISTLYICSLYLLLYDVIVSVFRYRCKYARMSQMRYRAYLISGLSDTMIVGYDCVVGLKICKIVLCQV